MIQIENVKLNLRNTYLKHKAVFDKESRKWVIDETKLSDDDIAFFKKEGVIKDDAKKDEPSKDDAKKDDPSDSKEKQDGSMTPPEEPSSKEETKEDLPSNIEIMLDLRKKPFSEYSKDEQIKMVNLLAEPIRDNKDIDILFPDFYRLADIGSLINREDFLSRVDAIIRNEEKDKDKVMEAYRFTELERALFKYEWLKGGDKNDML